MGSLRASPSDLKAGATQPCTMCPCTCGQERPWLWSVHLALASPLSSSYSTGCTTRTRAPCALMATTCASSTSSLDGESERLVHVALKRRERGRTAVLVAHRLS